MIFDQTSMKPGGSLVIPHSFINTKEAGIIESTTGWGINVVYNKGKTSQQRAFYSYVWLNQMYGDEPFEGENQDPADDAALDCKLDDDIPF